MQYIITSSNSSFLNESKFEENLLNLPGISKNEIIENGRNKKCFPEDSPSMLDHLDFYSASSSRPYNISSNIFDGKSINTGQRATQARSKYDTCCKHQNFFEEIFQTGNSQIFENSKCSAVEEGRHSKYLQFSDSMNSVTPNVFEKFSDHPKPYWFARTSNHELKKNGLGLFNPNIKGSRSCSYMSYFKEKSVKQDFVRNNFRRKNEYKNDSKDRYNTSNAFIATNGIGTNSNAFQSQISIDYQISCEDIYDLYADIPSIDTQNKRSKKNKKDNLILKSYLTHEKYRSWSPLRLFSSNSYDTTNASDKEYSFKKSIQKSVCPKVGKAYKSKDESQKVSHPILDINFNSSNRDELVKRKHSKRQSSKNWFSPASSEIQKIRDNNEETVELGKENGNEQINRVNDDDDLLLSSDEFQNRSSSGILKQRKEYA